MKIGFLGLVVLIVIFILGVGFVNMERENDEAGVGEQGSGIRGQESGDEGFGGDTKREVDFDMYNYEYADNEGAKRELERMLGDGKSALYLPPTGYVNVSRGGRYGVMFALQNVESSKGDYFEFNWSAAWTDCDVGLDMVHSWIKRGWTSFGRIGEGWVDHMVVYFVFPEDVGGCSVEYDLAVRKDGGDYDSKRLRFNLG